MCHKQQAYPTEDKLLGRKGHQSVYNIQFMHDACFSQQSFTK